MVKKNLPLLAAWMIVSLLIYYFLPDPKLPANIIIDKILVLKSKRQLLAYSKRKLIKTYSIALGFSLKGKKEFEHDGKTPEGIYFIDSKNAHSVCYKNLGISYPNAQDKAFANKYSQQPGEAIKIHGLPNGKGFFGKFHHWFDWTNGCIAVTDAEVDELYIHVPLGSVIEIKP